VNDKSQVLCRICGQPVELTFDIAVDEDGQAVHEMCYVKRIVVSKDELELVNRAGLSNRFSTTILRL
jgi:hypothetical protein